MKDRIIEILEENQDTFTGINEANLHSAEQIEALLLNNVKPFTGEMHQFLLVNALQLLTEEQMSYLCYDLYVRSNSELVDGLIKEGKTNHPPTCRAD